MSNDIFGKRLREIREKNQKTRKQVGEELNISPHTLSGYENGYRTPNLDMINKFADYYNVTTDWLLGRASTTSPNNKYTVPKWRYYQQIVINKIISELKANKKIQLSDDLRALFAFVGEINLAFIDSEDKDQFVPDLTQYKLAKVITGPGGHPDREESLGYDIIPKFQFDDEDTEYYIYICGDNSMDEFVPGDRILVKKTSEEQLPTIKNKDIVLVDAKGEFLLRRYYNVNENTIFQADNPDFPPILEAEIIGIVVSKMVDDEEDGLD